VGQSGGDALAHAAADLTNRLSTQVLANDVDAERKREPGAALPPTPEVFGELQPFLRVGQLPFVNDQSGCKPTFADRRNDLVERHHLELRDDEARLRRARGHTDADRHLCAERFRKVEVEGEEGGREQPRDGDRRFEELLGRELAWTGRELAWTDDHRPIVVAERATMAQQRVPIGDVRERMDADRA